MKADIITKGCITISDWFAKPICIILVPVICGIYFYLGLPEATLTAVLSVMAISLTQMILNAQNVDMETTKLQIAEIIKALPEARNEVIREDLSRAKVQAMRQEIIDDVTD